MRAFVKPAAVLIVLAVLAACSQAAPATGQKTAFSAENALSPAVSQPRDPAEALASVPERFRTGNDFRSCAHAAIVSCVSGPVTNEALRAADPELCGVLPDENVRQNCRTQVSIDAAVRSADVGVCAKAGDGYADGCRAEASRRLASEKGDPSWCDRLAAATKPDAAAIPPATTPYSPDMCRFSASMSTSGEKAASFCDGIKDEPLRASCSTMAENRRQTAVPGVLPGPGPQPMAYSGATGSGSPETDAAPAAPKRPRGAR